MSKRDAEHPIWSILRSTVMFGGLTVLLYVNATDFDMTELKVIIELVVLRGAWEGFDRVRKKRNGS